MISDKTAEQFHTLIQPIANGLHECLLPGEQVKFDYPSMSVVIRMKGSSTKTKTIKCIDESND